MPIQQTNRTELTRSRSALFGRPGQTVCYAAMILFGIWIGATIGVPHRADAGVRKGPEHEAFLSGSERSEKVLRDIAVIVARMDGRIANIEKAINQAARVGNQK